MTTVRAARPSRIVALAGDLFWFVVMTLAIPVGVLVVVLPVALVIRLVLHLTGAG